MKNHWQTSLTLLLILSCFASSSFAETQYVACKDLKASEYNVMLVLENGSLVATSMIGSDFKDVTRVVGNTPAVFLTYNTETAQHESYIIRNTQGMDQVIEIQGVNSGYSADTYFGVPSEVPVTCHLLKSAPVNSILTAENFQQVIPVRNTF